jgi:hypothetical protein
MKREEGFWRGIGTGRYRNKAEVGRNLNIEERREKGFRLEDWMRTNKERSEQEQA